MNETEVRAAIAQQEEYLKRRRSCAFPGQPARPGLAHSWETFNAGPGVFYRACWRCRVTETDDDYRVKIGAQPGA